MHRLTGKVLHHVKQLQCMIIKHQVSLLGPNRTLEAMANLRMKVEYSVHCRDVNMSMAARLFTQLKRKLCMLQPFKPVWGT